MSPSLRLWMQIWGGIFYLFNKIFLSFKERKEERKDDERARAWAIRAWAIYMLGLPPWLVLLVNQKNWMVTFVETGGFPSMLLGFILAKRRVDIEQSTRSQKLTVFLDRFAWASALVGVAFSIYKFGGMTQQSQWAELGTSVGFLIGTYQLAKNKLNGYLWFLLMNGSAGVLMYLDGFTWLALQQALSLGFVVDAYVMKSRRERKEREIEVLNVWQTPR